MNDTTKDKYYLSYRHIHETVKKLAVDIEQHEGYTKGQI